LENWFGPAKDTPNWHWGFTAKGWINNDYALAWLTEIFILQSRRGRDLSDTSYWRLLILDGHGSHATGEFAFECLVNQILLVFLLLYISHLCQPCDLGPFGHMKRYYLKHLKDFIATGETKVSRAQFNSLYHATRENAMSTEYI
jgi:serine/threonine protein phosphatase PrpC